MLVIRHILRAHIYAPAALFAILSSLALLCIAASEPYGSYGWDVAAGPKAVGALLFVFVPVTVVQYCLIKNVAPNQHREAAVARVFCGQGLPCCSHSCASSFRRLHRTSRAAGLPGNFKVH